MLPFTQLKLINYGPRMNRPSFWPWIWDTTIPHFNFWFQTEGAGRLISRDKEYRLEPGMCFLFTPGTKVWATSQKAQGMANFSVHFFPECHGSVSARKVEPIFGRKIRRMSLFLELSRDIIASFRQNDSLGLHQAEWGVLMMISHLWREAFHSPQAEEDEKMIGLLDEAAHSRESHSSIPDLAQKVGLSPSQFTRRVQAITDDSPANYIIRERISHACFLLVETSQSIKMIADKLGYADPSYFVRQFRKVMQITPSQYRHRALNTPPPA